MGITKAKVLPLPVTCEIGRRISPSLAPETNREKQEAPPVHDTHRFRSNIFVTHEERNGCGLEEKQHTNGSTCSAGSKSHRAQISPRSHQSSLEATRARGHPRAKPEGRLQGCDRARCPGGGPAQRSHGPEPPSSPPRPSPGAGAPPSPAPGSCWRSRGPAAPAARRG